jgi:hypothetical protein
MSYTDCLSAEYNASVRLHSHLHKDLPFELSTTFTAMPVTEDDDAHLGMPLLENCLPENTKSVDATETATHERRGREDKVRNQQQDLASKGSMAGEGRPVPVSNIGGLSQYNAPRYVASLLENPKDFYQ